MIESDDALSLQLLTVPPSLAMLQGELPSTSSVFGVRAPWLISWLISWLVLGSTVLFTLLRANQAYHLPLLTTYYVASPTSYFLLLPTIHYPLPTTRYPLPTTHYPLPTTHYLLLTTHYSLLTTHHSLLTTHFSLLTTHAAACQPGLFPLLG